MLLAKIKVTLKADILDPQGSALEKVLHNHNYPIDSVRVGKFLQLTLPDMEKEVAFGVVDEVCQKLLANPVIETYQFQLEEA